MGKTTPAQRRHYEANKALWRSRNKAKRAEIRAIVNEKKSVPCTDCGIQYDWWMMQFDHVSGKKNGSIAALLTNHNISAILDEMSKCEVVCANCHANRTYKRNKQDW